MSAGRVLMVQGTSSSAGKSFLVAGLCRLFAQEGLAVAPFKAQNMSNNACVTREGHEIGRAQAVQAMAARVAPHVDMNPILLKPESDHRSQVVLMGKPVATLHAAAYEELKARAWDEVAAALDRLRAEYDLVVIEGAGSPAEINLKPRDIANMRVARYAEAPVLIVGDIDRGGVFAHLYGTHALLDPEEQALVRGFVINRFRGDPSLLEPGLAEIERLTGVPVAGVVPWVHDHGIPEEDAVALERRGPQAPGSFAGVDVAVILFPRIANFDDFDPLAAEPDVRVRYVSSPVEIAGADLVFLPGTKATIADLAWLRSQGFAEAIEQARGAGACVAGICGGLQALGTLIEDPYAVESSAATARGLGLLDLTTTFQRVKTTTLTTGRVTWDEGAFAGLEGIAVDGYEIHAGRSIVRSPVPMRRDTDGRPLGAVDASGWVFGTYLHGMFQDERLRHGLLANIAARRGKEYRPAAIASHDAAFDRLAGVLRSSLDLPRIFAMVGLER